MRGAERIIFAFRPFGETGQAAALSQGSVDFACGYGGGLTRMLEYGNVLLTGAEKEELGILVFDVTSAPAEFVAENSDLVAKFLKNADPVHKVSIIPRGQALGITMQMPVEDRFNHDREYLLDQISIMMGGRLGEELVLGQMTTGASNDFERATQLARNMVTQWGMSDEMGPMVYGEREHEPFLGREITRQTNISEETARKIDIVVRKLIEENYDRAKHILEEHMDQLHLLAKALIKYETLDTTDIDRVMAGKEPLLIKEIETKPSSSKKPPEEPSEKVDIGDEGSASESATDEAGQPN